MASGSDSGDRTAQPYRKRRPIPALIVIGVLGLGALSVWVNAIISRVDVNVATHCDPPAAPLPGITYTSLDHAALDDRAPMPPDRIAVKVLNASSVRGQGGLTTEALKALGFTQVAPPEDDPAYAGRDAKCRGQIRFGDNGMAAARTLSLVAPCVELVRDNRGDATVDLTIGTSFGDLRPTAEATKILQQLKMWSAQHQGGGEQAAIPAVVDRTLLTSARDVTC